MQQVQVQPDSLFRNMASATGPQNALLTCLASFISLRLRWHVALGFFGPTSKRSARAWVASGLAVGYVPLDDSRMQRRLAMSEMSVLVLPRASPFWIIHRHRAAFLPAWCLAFTYVNHCYSSMRKPA